METAVKARTAEDLLKELQTDTFGLLTNLEHKTPDVNITDRLDKMETDLEEAMKVKEANAREMRVKTVKANVEALRADMEKEEGDLAQAVLGLRELMNKMGFEWTGLAEASPEERGMVTRAEFALQKAKEALSKAESGFWFKSKRIAAAQNYLATCESGLQHAKAESARLYRKRLMSSNMEKSLQTFTTQVLRALKIMEARSVTIESERVKVAHRLIEALGVKEEAAKKLEMLDKALSDTESKVKLAEMEMAGLTNGTAAYVAKETEVTKLRNEMEELRGQRNVVFVLYQSKERFAAELAIHELAQRKLRDNQRAWMMVLKSDTQERLVTYTSRLEGMKGVADQQVARGLDKIGTEIDARNAEAMARFGAASDEVRQQMVEDHPERLARIANAAAGQAEAAALMREREAKAFEAFSKHYGVKASASSIFSYQNTN